MSENLTELLKLAKKYGLKSLKTPDFEFEFSEKAPSGRGRPPKSSKQQQTVDREEELANLLITDPSAYENIMFDTMKSGG